MESYTTIKEQYDNLVNNMSLYEIKGRKTALRKARKAATLLQKELKIFRKSTLILTKSQKELNKIGLINKSNN